MLCEILWKGNRPNLGQRYMFTLKGNLIFGVCAGYGSSSAIMRVDILTF